MNHVTITTDGQEVVRMARKRVLGATAAVVAGLALTVAAAPASADQGGVPGNCIAKEAVPNASVIASTAQMKPTAGYVNLDASLLGDIASVYCGPR